MEYPLASFLLFTYCQEKFIASAIEGALNQDYPNLEIHIADDCSSDKTFDIIVALIEKYTGPHKVYIHRHPQNLGTIKNVNAILKIVKGEFICWNAGDDIAKSTKIRKLISPMLDDKDVMGVDSGVIEINLNGEIVGQRLKPTFDYKNDSLERIIKYGLSVCSQSHAFRRCVVEYFGDFEPFVVNEGRPLAFRERALGKIAFIEEPQTYYRIGSGISTYRGNDYYKNTVTEPLKIVHWHLTSINQIKKDLEKTPFLGEKEIDRLRAVIDDEIDSCDIRIRIIEQSWNLKALLSSLKKQRIRSQGIKDFLKRNAPKFLLDMLYKNFTRL